MIRNASGCRPLDLLALEEVAHLLAEPPCEVERLVATEKLRSFRFGDHDEVVRVLRLDVSEYVESLSD